MVSFPPVPLSPSGPVQKRSTGRCLLPWSLEPPCGLRLPFPTPLESLRLGEPAQGDVSELVSLSFLMQNLSGNYPNPEEVFHGQVEPPGSPSCLEHVLL